MNENRRLPAVDRVLAQLADQIEVHGRQLVTACVRAELAAAREGLKHGLALPEEDSLLAAIRRRADEAGRANLRAVFNLTGTVLHTNLGRALLSEEAIALMVEAARSPCALEDSKNAVRAESGDSGHGYLKNVYQGKDLKVDPIADDLASLALDLLVNGAGCQAQQFTSCRVKD